MNRNIVCILCMALTFCLSQAQSVLQNVYSRDTTSLNGIWQTIVDPYDNGYYDYRLNVMNNGFFKNAKPQSPYDHTEYDFCDAETLTVPGDWNTQEEKFFLYEGSMWYKKDFDYNLKPGNRLYVYFGASNYATDVYLNGEKLGTHIGGFTPFNFDITDKIKEKDNFLVLRVNNVRVPEGVPTVNSDWWNYGGLTRDVMLVETPEISVDDYSIKLGKDAYDKIDVSVSLNKPLKAQKVTISIPELKLKETIETNVDGKAYASFNTKPQLWSPESPKLYDVEIINGEESIKDRIGFRHISTRGKEILLNGNPIFLRGISIHEEAPFRSGRCNSAEDDSTLLAWAKELNCNFLRLAHYPHNEQMVRMAEEQGFLLWSEIPVYWTIHWNNPATLSNASQQLSDNMTRDKNRCAIIVWSLANETPHSPERDKFLSALAEQARKADDERLISMAMEVSWQGNNTSKVEDSMNKYVDIISFNNYLGWYGGKPEDCDSRNYIIPYEKPFFVSEFGGGALAGLHGDANQKWTEEYQDEIYKHTLAMYDRHEGFAGCSPWILVDFRSPRRQNHSTQNLFNRKGIISPEGKKKAAFYTLRNFYKDKMQQAEQ